MIEKCYNKTQNKALRDSNLKGLLINNSLLGVIMTATNNTRNVERGQSRKSSLVYGIGFDSGGKHKKTIKGIRCHEYIAWKSMIRRCYCPDSLAKFPTYNGCTVSDEWHDFQVFAEWMKSKVFSKRPYQLDKDILINGNKVYSDEHCCFVPQEINSLFTDSGKSRGKYPQGVCLNSRVGNFRSTIRINGKYEYLGLFDCPQEAHQAYVIAKEAYVKEVANEWRGRIEDRVYDALMKWSLNN